VKIRNILYTVEPLLTDTSARRRIWHVYVFDLLRTPMFSPKLVISIHFDLCNQDTSQLRTAIVSPKGVRNREVPLYIVDHQPLQPLRCLAAGSLPLKSSGDAYLWSMWPPCWLMSWLIWTWFGGGLPGGTLLLNVLHPLPPCRCPPPQLREFWSKKQFCVKMLPVKCSLGTSKNAQHFLYNLFVIKWKKYDDARRQDSYTSLLQKSISLHQTVNPWSGCHCQALK
jgi:hypothetical protein